MGGTGTKSGHCCVGKLEADKVDTKQTREEKRQRSLISCIPLGLTPTTLATLASPSSTPISQSHTYSLQPASQSWPFRLHGHYQCPQPPPFTDCVVPVLTPYPSLALPYSRHRHPVVVSRSNNRSYGNHSIPHLHHIAISYHGPVAAMSHRAHITTEIVSYPNPMCMCMWLSVCVSVWACRYVHEWAISYDQKKPRSQSQMLDRWPIPLLSP